MIVKNHHGVREFDLDTSFPFHGDVVVDNRAPAGPHDGDASKLSCVAEISNCEALYAHVIGPYVYDRPDMRIRTDQFTIWKRDYFERHKVL